MQNMQSAGKGILSVLLLNIKPLYLNLYEATQTYIHITTSYDKYQLSQSTIAFFLVFLHIAGKNQRECNQLGR